MDEKERQKIEKRAFDKAKISIPDYIQGALDQDPISRKKRTEEILAELKIERDEYEPGGEAWNVVQDCIKRIEALP